jgi:hypothetical protein
MFSTDAGFFSNISEAYLVESTPAKPSHMDDQLYLFRIRKSLPAKKKIKLINTTNITKPRKITHLLIQLPDPPQ